MLLLCVIIVCLQEGYFPPTVVALGATGSGIRVSGEK